MSKGVIIGIDFSSDYTQLSVLGDSYEPESIKLANLGDEYLMPTAVFYNSELQEWSVGIEAFNRSKVEAGVYIDRLPERMLADFGVVVEDKKMAWSEIGAIFFRKIINAVLDIGDDIQIKHIVISVDDPLENIMHAIYGAFGTLGFRNNEIRVLNHAESFAYYVLNQSKDIWINNVLMVDFSENATLLRRLFVTKGREPYNVDIKKTDITDKISFEMLKIEAGRIEADTILCDILKEEIDKNVISAIYLNGQGFMKEGWYGKTIEAIRSNRRLFAGNNLIVKGTNYAAKDFFYTNSLEKYMISCKGRTVVNVSMDVVHRNIETKVKLSRAGIHWYEAGAKTQCILDNVNKAHFTIFWPATKETKEFDVNLSGFPRRNNKTVRVEVSLAYTDENSFTIEIRDVGFGEFFEASGVVARHEVEL